MACGTPSATWVAALNERHNTANNIATMSLLDGLAQNGLHTGVCHLRCEGRILVVADNRIASPHVLPLGLSQMPEALLS